MKTMKYAILMIALLIVLCSCQKFKYDNTTVLGQVTAIDGQQVTLLVNEMDMSGNMLPGNFDGGQGNMPQMPEGGMPSFGGGEMPNMGDMPQMPGGAYPGGMGNMQSPFGGEGEAITLTLNADTLKTLSVGSLVQITFGEKGSILSLEVLGNMSGSFFGGFEGMTPPSVSDSGSRS